MTSSEKKNIDPRKLQDLYNAFDNGEILCRGDDLLKIKLNVGEDVFFHWYLTDWPETVTIIEPQHIKERLVSQAQTILKKYGGRD